MFVASARASTIGSYDMFHPNGEEVPPMPIDLANSLKGPGHPARQDWTARLDTMASMDLLSHVGTCQPLSTKAYQTRESRSKALD